MQRRRLTTIRLACAAATLLGALPAAASGADVYGLGSNGIARGGAMTAVATGQEATFYNPAGLAFGARPELAFGFLHVQPALHIDTPSRHLEPGIANPDLIMLGVGLPFGKHFALGFSLYNIPGSIAHVLANAPEEPVFPYWNNRSQRLLLLPSLAIRPFDWISVGVAVNYLAGLGGSVSANEGPTHGVEANVSEELPTVAVPNFGLRVQPSDALAFGLVYRSAFAMPYSTSTRNFVVGQELDVSIDAHGLETPAELAFGAYWQPRPVRLSLDVTWLRWSEAHGPFVDVNAFVNPLPIHQTPPTDLYRDTWNLRLGLEVEKRLAPDWELALRGGQFFEPTYVRDQPQRSNLLDGDKLGWSLGAGVRAGKLVSRPLRLDVHAQVTHMLQRRYDKRVSSLVEAADDPQAIADEDQAPGVQITNPGYPWISGGGSVWTFGATLTLELGP